MARGAGRYDEKQKQKRGPNVTPGHRLGHRAFGAVDFPGPTVPGAGADDGAVGGGPTVTSPSGGGAGGAASGVFFRGTATVEPRAGASGEGTHPGGPGALGTASHPAGASRDTHGRRSGVWAWATPDARPAATSNRTEVRFMRL